MSYATGVIGTSFIAENHAQAYENVEDIDLVAVADIDPSSLAEFAEKHSIPSSRTYSTHEELLAEEALDILSVATPSFLHHGHVIDATQSAADPDAIWCEKPIGLSVTEGEEMIAACDDTDTELVINHQRRFADEYRALRRQIHDENLLGEIEAVHSHSPRELLRNGTHTVDLLMFLLDSMGAEVMGYITEERGLGSQSGTDEEVTFDDAGGGGTIVTEDQKFVTIDQTTPRPVSKGRKEFVGSEGMLMMPGDSEWSYWRLEENEEGSYGTSHVETPIPPELTKTSGQAKFDNGARHIVNLIDGDMENLSSGEDATHVLEIIVAMFLSHYTGSRVSLPLDRPLRDIRILSG
ncbi:Gfo/Idh/MocA family protein [Saliphagus sp. LR7]|uniref:Gfo/Idh/MocA family protein n=1 Tax=Saliphagus sp. LR7 TaxID=2282654 RepID=UPI000DF7B090|nr:Gfo/Idh/MocA family oxidoreductase [Saliphagus sp. LR7]